MFDFEVKIAENDAEVRLAERLRYEVFKLEIGNAPPDEDEIDADAYDKLCDHLIVIDKTINKVIGTYRLLRGTQVDEKLGFYSEKFFDIARIKKLARQFPVVELGRSCIYKEYRTKPVMNLLWSGIARYITDYNIRFLFGSVRLRTDDPQEVATVFQFLKDKYYAAEEFRVHPRQEKQFDLIGIHAAVEHPKLIFRTLPPLMKGYLRVGVKVCGPPAHNPDLNSVVIFILLDTEHIASAYKQHYL